MKIAIATFVKTPGMSPIKTRLAATIGARSALEFYVSSVGETYKTIEKLKAQTVDMTPYWAVSEKQALGSVFWKSWPQIWQGEGGLGERIAHIYTELKSKFDVVALYGADSPHVSVERLLLALEKFQDPATDTVVGPAEDGGFYFLASRMNVDPKIWQRVAYSTTQTLQELKNNWPTKMLEIETDFDVDTESEMKRSKQLLERLSRPSVLLNN